MNAWEYLAEALENSALGLVMGLLARPWLDGRVAAGTRWLRAQQQRREERR